MEVFKAKDIAANLPRLRPGAPSWIRKIFSVSWTSPCPGWMKSCPCWISPAGSRARAYDRIVVDTAPSGHTLRLLATPDLMRHWLKALDVLLAKHRFMQQRFRGSYQRDELDDFLLELGSAVKRMDGLLQDQHACRFVPVMLAEELVISETEKLLGELKSRRISVKEVLVNRLYPENSCPLCGEGRRRQRRLLANFLSRRQRSRI